MAQAGQRFDGIGNPSTLDLSEIQDELGAIRQCEFEHGDPMVGRGMMSFGFERLFRGRNEPDLCKTKTRGGGLGHGQMR